MGTTQSLDLPDPAPAVAVAAAKPEPAVASPSFVKSARASEPETEFDDLPVRDDPAFVAGLTRIPASELATRPQALLDGLRRDGVVVVQLDEAQQAVTETALREICGGAMAGDEQELLKCGMELEECRCRRGYVKLQFDNYDNRRLYEERQVYELHGAQHLAQAEYPSEAFGRAAEATLRLGQEVTVDALLGLQAALQAQLTQLLAPGCPDTQDKQVLLAGNCGSNQCFFRYTDVVGYPGPQQCMVHVDGGLLTLLPRSSQPGIELLAPGATHWVPVEPHMAAGEALLYSGQTLQLLTAGLLPGTVHRVVRQPGVERWSLPFELKPSLDAPIRTLSEAPLVRAYLDGAEWRRLAAAPVFSHAAFCDCCGKPVGGRRFKCRQCPDYDLCKACVPRAAEVHDPAHEVPELLLPWQDRAEFAAGPGGTSFDELARTVDRQKMWARMERSMYIHHGSSGDVPPSGHQPIPSSQ